MKTQAHWNLFFGHVSMWNPGLKKPYFRFNTYILDIGLYLFCTQDIRPGFYTAQ